MQPKYLRIAESLTTSIAHGTWEPGERIPSVRALSEMFEVSVNTVREALAVLHDRGFLLPSARSGNYVLALPSATTHETYIEDIIGHTLGRGSKVTIDASLAARLDVSILPSDLVDRGALKRALSSAVDAHPHLVSGYAVVDRTLELRQFIARRALQAGIVTTPDEIVLTQGVLDAILKLLLMLTRPGDRVAVESPTYYPVLQMLRVLRRTPVYLPAYPDGSLDVSPLYRKDDRPVTAVLVTPSFQNPLGSSLKVEAREAVLTAARDIDAVIIEDDVHRETYAGTMPLPAIRSLDDGSHVLLCSSYSKIISPALRLGWIIAGQRATDIRTTSRAVSCTVSGVTAAAVTQWVLSGRFERTRRQVAQALHDGRQHAVKTVMSTFPTGTRTYSTEGGMSLWVELPPCVDTMDVYRLARREGIAFAPGPVFGPDERFLHALRLSPGLFKADARNATQRIGELAQSLAEKSDLTELSGRYCH